MEDDTNNVMKLHLHYEDEPENVKRNLQIEADIALRYLIDHFRIIFLFSFSFAQITCSWPFHNILSDKKVICNQVCKRKSGQEGRVKQ